ncbi:MAG: hypothetical protein NC251_04400 [Lachnoclostridium sp.]|nr:hypothetical protein [Lachnospira sp.]MCM1247653.1 hypothetical protein [Lachnoclostridium sp.]
MSANLSEQFPEGCVEVRNSPKIETKFMIVSILGVVIEEMVLVFLGLMCMDDSVEWTGELIFYVSLAVVLPVVIVAEGIAGARLVSRERIYFDKETILLNLKFRKPKVVKWSLLGGMVKTGSVGFTLVDREGKRVVAADITMINYNAFYDMAIRQCKDYKKEQQKEKTGTFSANTGRLCMDPGLILLAVLFAMGISAFIMSGIVEMSRHSLAVALFEQSLSAGKVCLIMAVLPTAALLVLLPLQTRRYWKYSDHGLELSYVFRKPVQLSWAQITRVEVKVIKTERGESYGFILYTAFDQYSSGNLLTKGNRDFKLQVERMAELYGFEIVRG